MFAFTDRRGSVEVAFTDRHGGVSSEPFDSLNLAEASADDPAAVADNLRRVVAGLAGDTPPPVLVRMHQVHGATVHRVAAADLAEPVVPTADGLVTDLPGVALMVRVADCVPVLLADPSAGVIGVAHAGRPGLVAGVVPATVAAMREAGAESVTGWIGPHVCGRCYEVPAAMRAEVADVVPAAYAETSWGTPAVDVGAGVRAQLAEAEVSVTDASDCTLENDDLFSYRREGDRAGRLAGLVWVRP